MIRRCLIGLVVLGFLWTGWPKEENSHATTELAPMQPDQQTMSTPMMFSHKGVKLVAVATYQLKARVLGRKDYQWDPMAKFCPTDLALGWGIMSNPDVTNRMQITQSNRWYYWHTPSWHVSRADIENNSANVHIIPATPEIQKILDHVRQGQIVEMKGYLVNAAGPDGTTWRSSLSRGDVGAGSCEIFYVQKLR